ncbi:MAG: hypothetical protein PUF72_02485 [Clostridiales bacterium]|nr:hypothetical protein [Clostridiales bacterium]
MTYIKFVCDEIENIEEGTPIYTKDIAKKIADNYCIKEKDAALAAAVAFKRIMDGNTVPRLRFYKKGIYYKAAITPFGETKINKEQLIADKYILPDRGYETGLSLMYKIGLTTQIPNERTIATNAAKDCARADKRLGVIIKPPKVKITEKNKDYLQILDALELIDKAPVDERQPYTIIAGQIKKRNLQYEKLLAFANNYYGKKTILQLANTASAGGVHI